MTIKSCVRYFTIGVQYGYSPHQILHPRLITSTQQYVKVLGKNEHDCRVQFMEALAPFERKWSHCYETAESTHMKGGIVDLADAVRDVQSELDWEQEIRRHIEPLSPPSAKLALLDDMIADYHGSSAQFTPACLAGALAVQSDIIAQLETELRS